MKLLITADLHLSDRPKDAYRFGLFDWLKKKQKEHSPDAVLILGDITDQKDKHSATLVNGMVDGLTKLKPPVIILKGNHDYSDPKNPYFRFLNKIEGLQFVIETTEVLPKHWMVPHCGTQEEFNRECGKIAPKPEGVYVHGLFEGAIAETGRRLSGLQASPIELLKPLGCWAGDVHKPQQCGPLTYVGAPYHVRFGDNFTPRVLLVDGNTWKNLYFECPHKWSLIIKDADDLLHNDKLMPNDQVKLTVELTREEVVEWAAHKRSVLAACKKLELEVFGVELAVVGAAPKARAPLKAADAKSNLRILTEYCKAERVAHNIARVGAEIMEDPSV